MTKKTATEIIQTLDPTHTLKRERDLESYALTNLVPIEWVKVAVSYGSDSGHVYVSKTPLMVGTPEDGVRIFVNQVTAQQICDQLKDVPEANAPEGVVMPTPKIADLFHIQSKLLPAFTQTPGPDMQDTDRCVLHSRKIDEAIAAAGDDGASYSPQGKLRPCYPAMQSDPEHQGNYGWLGHGSYRSVLGLLCWQPLAKAHLSGYNAPGVPQGYADYSEFIQVVRIHMVLNGQVEDLREVALDSVKSRVVSTLGPVVLRHPAVPDPDQAPVSEEPETPSEPELLEPPKVVFTRTLRQGMTGSDVAELQRLLSIKTDGIFGPATQLAVKSFQRNENLSVDGVVGPATQKALLDALPGNEETSNKGLLWDPRKARFQQAKYFRGNVQPRYVDHIILHSAEVGEFPNSAEALAYAAAHNDGKRPASWHWAFDNNSGVLCVKEEDIAFHAKKGNRYTVGYEHAGFARQTRSEWLDDYSEQMLHNSARTAALVTCPRWNLPIQKVGPRELFKARQLRDSGQPVPDEYRGFAYHSDVTVAFKVSGGHMDPDLNRGYFPIDYYLQLVKNAG